MTLGPGSLLNNRYRIIEVLGQGGMAAVYRAIDENLGVEVAVKENLFTTEEYARQFRLEATILAGLRQANLPRVSDHFVIEPLGQYLVMDFIEGEDLRQRLDRLGPLPEQEVIIVGVAISDALAYMHTRIPMILHRDIKPGNIRITPGGHIFLVDFGLAKMVEGRETTNTGARAMTPGYSPPEQYGTARTDPRSDIYSLGASLYSALTNVLPEDGLDRAMGRCSLTPIGRHNPKVSENIASIIEKCLSIVPEERYQSADELRYALMEARSISKRKVPLELVLHPPPMSIHDRLPIEGGEEQQKARAANIPDSDKRSTRQLLPIPDDKEVTPGKRNSRKAALTWFLVALLPILILSGYSIFTIKPEYLNQALGFFIPGRTVTSSATSEPFSSTAIAIVGTSPPPHTATKTPSPSITNTSIPTNTSTSLPTSTRTATAAPTPMGGGNQIAFASNRSGSVEIWIMNTDGTGLEMLTSIAEGVCQPEWSPDGSRIIFISPCKRNMNYYPGASMFIMNADGSSLIPLPSVPGGDYDPSWSPDGTQIAFTSLRKDGVPGIYIITLNDYNVKSLVEDETRAISQPAWSPDGSQIAYVNSDNRIWVMDTNGENRRSLIQGGGDYLVGNPAWSPDGSAVIFTRSVFSDTTGSTLLMAVPYTEDGAVPVEVPNSQLITDVSYSSDGFWLIFTSWFSGSHDINIMRANGIDRQAIVADPAYDFDPAWRPYLIIQP